MLFTASFRRTGKEIQMTTYNGIILLDFNRLSGIRETREIGKLAAELPQTLAAFTGVSGRSVKVLVRFTKPDGTLPVTQEDIRIYQAHAYIMAIRIYQPQIPFPIDLKEPLPERGCRFTYDPYLYYAPGAHPILMKQPDTMPIHTDIPEIRLNEPNPLQRLPTGYEKYKMVSLLYETSLREASSYLSEEEDRKAFLVQLAKNCFKSGIPQEDACWWTVSRLDHQEEETEIRETFGNVHQKQSGFGSKPCICPEQDLFIRLAEFMKRRYEVHFNSQTQQVEYRKNQAAHFHFSPIDERVLNSMSLDALSEGLHIWDRDIKCYIHSDRVPSYFPLEEYLFALPEWDGEDHIRSIARMIECENPLWPELFFCWFLSMVAQWSGRKQLYGNSLSPLLISPQGFGKTTFCKSLLPPELRNLYTDRIDFSRKKEAELSLHRFDQISSRDQGFLKHILTKTEITTRTAYKSTFVTRKRYASFIATSNHKELLTDISGNRRFICIEIKKPIDNSTYINYPQLYAQAKTLLYRDTPYWLTPEQEAGLAKSNEEFRHRPIAEQLFHSYFRAGTEEEPGQWLLAVEILQILCKKSGLPISEQKAISFGRILKKQEIPRRVTMKGTRYHVAEKGHEG